MLCYLSYIFKDLSCFLEEKAIGPMPPHREAIHGFARSIGNMSTLLILASLELKQAALQLQPSLAQRQMVDSAMPHGGIDDLCQASWCDLFDIWACIKPLFGTLQADLTFWSRYKKGRGSPPDADYKTMAEALSYAVFAVRSFAKIETALVWYLFNGTSYVSLDYYTSIGVSLTRAFSFMKLGREMTSREVVERQIYPIYYHNPKPVGIVLPFRSPYDIETVGNVMPREKLRIWYEYPEDCPFRYLYYNAMESARYIEHRKLLTSTNNPELCSRSVSRPVQMRQMLWRSKASRLIKDRDIWIGQERTSRYDQFTEAATLRGVISVSLGHKRTKKMLVSLHPTYLLLFRERGVSLVLRDEIPRANILLVTHDFQGPPRYEVGVCWKSASTEPTSMAYMKLVFDDSTEAKVWASCLAPKDLPYELIAECLEGDFVPKHSNIDGEFSGTRLAGPQAPPAESFLQDLTMNQVQRLLFRVKNQDLDLLHYRIFTIPRGLEAVVIQDPHTEASYAAIDIVVDDTPSSLEVNRLPSGDTEVITRIDAKVIFI